MKYLLMIAFMLAAVPVFAQKQNVYFLKNDGTYLPGKDSADYIRVVRQTDSTSALYDVLEYYPNTTRKLAGKSSRVNPPYYQGICITYYNNGKKEQVLNYQDNMLAGMQYSYYPNGQLYTSTDYGKPNQRKYLEKDAAFLYKDEYDSLGNVWVKDGIGYYRRYDSKFKRIIEEGVVKNGKPDGRWKGVDQGMKLRYVETYVDGKLASGISIGEKGDTVTYEKERHIPPHYKGGQEAFGWYLGHYITYPPFEKENNIQGKVILSFVIEKDGSITEIKVRHSVSVNIDAEAVRVIQESKKWVPGIAYGRPIRTVFTVPISFTLN